MAANIATNSVWTFTQIERYLDETTMPCRLACITGDGFPHVTSLWYLYYEGRLWFSVQQSAKISQWLAHEPKCGFEIAVNEAPYVGVRGRGLATCSAATDERTLRRLINRFLGDDNSDLATWLLSRTATEVTISVEPQWLTSWDYAARMS